VAKHIAKHITVPERAKPATAAAATADAGGDEEPSGHIPRAQLLTELSRIAAKPDTNLQAVLPAGIAFHHSGLQLEEKKLVEQAFCTGWSGWNVEFVLLYSWDPVVDTNLQVVLPAGIAFHHSGLQLEEKKPVVQAFCTGQSGQGYYVPAELVLCLAGPVCWCQGEEDVGACSGAWTVCRLLQAPGCLQCFVV
jgi:hypothetical protein